MHATRLGPAGQSMVSRPPEPGTTLAQNTVLLARWSRLSSAKGLRHDGPQSRRKNPRRSGNFPCLPHLRGERPPGFVAPEAESSRHLIYHEFSTGPSSSAKFPFGQSQFWRYWAFLHRSGDHHHPYGSRATHVHGNGGPVHPVHPTGSSVSTLPVPSTLSRHEPAAPPCRLESCTCLSRTRS